MRIHRSLVTSLAYGLLGLSALLAGACGGFEGGDDSNIAEDTHGGDAGTAMPSPSESSGDGKGGGGTGSSDLGGASSSVAADAAPVASGILTAGVWDDNRNLARFLGYRASLKPMLANGVLPFTDVEHAAANTNPAFALRPHTKLDVSLVIDTTGSMGDEIKYLQAELSAIRAAIQTAFPSSQQRWSLVDYKDISDPYVVHPFDFQQDAAGYQATLDALSASGGGDFPESPDQGLAAANALSWRTDADTARLIFWVADAPHHSDRGQQMADAIRGAAQNGIKIYPVASSGIDELTELTMRSAAQLTGGRHMFLTNDSGVGGPHKEPSIPCYFLTKLDRAMLRTFYFEMSGNYHEP
ncbi:MAG: hypothetical protein JWM74_3369, partial [Myxococcaceae bacterium]|nr:hypothetical protein [Myxococcaceae bacterium]